jgi:hypothetical protein
VLRSSFGKRPSATASRKFDELREKTGGSRAAVPP